MKKHSMRYFFLLLLCITIVMTAHWNYARTVSHGYIETKSTSNTLTNEAFNTIMQVLTHPRCMNCHPTDNIPKQGDNSHPHYFGLQRGASGHGFDGLQCAACHQTENNDFSGVPGAPHWGLAPASMGWQGLSNREIALALIDRSKNGDRSPEDLFKHMTEDALVLWAWNPGVNAEGIEREVPPVTTGAFAKALQIWFDNGTPIPNE